MNRLESQLADAAVRCRARLPDVSEVCIEALFCLRRQRWVEPLGKVKRHG